MAVGTLPPELYEQQQALNRQQKMAQLLMQQGQQMPQSQMVSGRYVAPSIFQNIAPLVQTYMGQKMLERGDKQALDIAAQLRQRYGDELKEFRNIMQGREELAPEQAGPTQTGQAIPQEMVRSAPNVQGAYDYAASAYNPLLQQIGAKKLAEGPIKAGIEDTLIDPITLKPIFTGAGKPRAPVQIDTGSHIEFRDALDPNIVIARVPKVKDASAGKDFGNALSLRKEFNNEGIYKGYQEVKNAWSQINTGLNSKSPAGDLAAATKFMKLLDPGSVVRESELAMAMQASGALDRLYNYAQMRVAGTKLTPTQREDFRKLSDDFYQTSLNQYNEKFGEYKDIALRNNLNPDDVGKPATFKPQELPKREEKPKPISAQQSNVSPARAPKFLGFE
jgi:hypothetical protein